MKIPMITILLAVYPSQWNANAADTCLSSKEKDYIKTMKNNVKELNLQINGIENSLKDTIVIAPKCPSGWKRYREHCYFFSSKKATWFQGQIYCQGRGSYLADIQDQKENKWIIKHVPSRKQIVWIGGVDLKEGLWLWTNNYSSIKYLPWGKHAPNGGYKENCLQLYTVDGTWHDHFCDKAFDFVCKKKLKCECKV